MTLIQWTGTIKLVGEYDSESGKLTAAVHDPEVDVDDLYAPDGPDDDEEYMDLIDKAEQHIRDFFDFSCIQ